MENSLKTFFLPRLTAIWRRSLHNKIIRLRDFPQYLLSSKIEKDQRYRYINGEKQERQTYDGLRKAIEMYSYIRGFSPLVPEVIESAE
jgi:hypothetical protein